MIEKWGWLVECLDDGLLVGCLNGGWFGEKFEWWVGG